jgi:hypothetical protein
MSEANVQLLQTAGARNCIELIGDVHVRRTAGGLAVTDDEYTYNFNRKGALVDQTVRREFGPAGE